MDRDDKRALHFLAFKAGKVVGTARLVMHHRSAKVGRMAVLKNYRRKGIGTKLLRKAILTARRQGVQHIYLHAQVPVIGFYEALAFRCVGPFFTEAGFPHGKMVQTNNRKSEEWNTGPLDNCFSEGFKIINYFVALSRHLNFRTVRAAVIISASRAIAMPCDKAT